jgi:sphinganine-1-phosphate aldolase
MNKARLDIEAKLVPKGSEVVRHLTLPGEGKSAEWIFSEMEKMDSQQGSTDWRHGKLSGAVYRELMVDDLIDYSLKFMANIDGGEELEKIIVSAYQKYCVSNPLHPDVFPAVRKMEAEIVSMCLNMYHNPGGAGTMTSGGTESIVMAVKTYRDWARDVKGITEPEMFV